MTLSPACRAFRETMKKLAFVDRADVPALKNEPGDWFAFTANPTRYFLRCPDEIAGQIWAAMGMEKNDGT